MKNGLLIIGATSAIATAVARMAAGDGIPQILAGRDERKLAILRDDLIARGAPRVETLTFDAHAHERGAHERGAVIDAAFALMPHLDTVLIAHGVLVGQAEAEADPDLALESIDVNFSSVVALLTPIAQRFDAAGNGTIAVISSTSGDRGRRKNYVYGAAKGGLSIFMQGLRHRLDARGVRVLTFKPGFVDTPMTAAMPKNALFAKADDVASGIYHALRKPGGEYYLPRFWRPIMSLIQHIPERIFLKLNI